MAFSIFNRKCLSQPKPGPNPDPLGGGGARYGQAQHSSTAGTVKRIWVGVGDAGVAAKVITQDGFPGPLSKTSELCGWSPSLRVCGTVGHAPPPEETAAGLLASRSSAQSLRTAVPSRGAPSIAGGGGEGWWSWRSSRQAKSFCVQS